MIASSVSTSLCSLVFLLNRSARIFLITVLGHFQSAEGIQYCYQGDSAERLSKKTELHNEAETDDAIID